jgi:hypothetical protein
MKIQVTFDKPINGYWNGGPKSEGIFEVDSCHRLSDQHVCFGSWGLNHFFNVKIGRSEKETLSRAIRHLRNNIRFPAKIEAV